MYTFRERHDCRQKLGSGTVERLARAMQEEG
jgi:hypothetical protein